MNHYTPNKKHAMHWLIQMSLFLLILCHCCRLRVFQCMSPMSVFLAAFFEFPRNKQPKLKESGTLGYSRYTMFCWPCFRCEDMAEFLSHLATIIYWARVSWQKRGSSHFILLIHLAGYLFPNWQPSDFINSVRYKMKLLAAACQIYYGVWIMLMVNDQLTQTVYLLAKNCYLLDPTRLYYPH